MNRKRCAMLAVLAVLLLSSLACALQGGSGTEEQPPQAEVLRQWASDASASSEYSTPDWSAWQATGAPDTDECGDFDTAWASASSDGVDWLELEYDDAVIPSEINVYETHSPGFVAEVEVRDESGGYHTVWTGTPAAVEECPRVFSVSVSGVNRPVVAVRINLDQSDGGWWDEIDAVELVGELP